MMQQMNEFKYLKSSGSEFLKLSKSNSTQEQELLEILVKALNQEKDTTILSKLMLSKCKTNEGKLCIQFIQWLYINDAKIMFDEYDRYAGILNKLLNRKNYDYLTIKKLFISTSMAMRKEKLKNAEKYIANIIICLGMLE